MANIQSPAAPARTGAAIACTICQLNSGRRPDSIGVTASSNPDIRSPENPLLEGKFSSEVARTLRITLLTLAVILPVLLLAVVLDSHTKPSEVMALAALMFALAGLYLLLRTGRIEWVFSGLVALLIIYATAATAVYGSIRSTSSLAFVGAIVIGGIFLSSRALVAAVVASVIALGALVIAERTGWLPQPNYTVSALHWLIYSAVLGTIALNVYYAHRMMNRALFRMEEQFSERRRAEVALGQSEDSFQSLFRNSPAALIIAAQPGGLVREINEAYERMFLTTRAELIDRTTSDLSLWASNLERDQYIAELLRDGKASNRRVRFRRRDGELFEAIISTEQLEWRGERGVFSTITDISSETRIRDALRASEQRFSAAFHFSPIGMTITRMTDGKLLEVNLADERVLGYKREETLGRSTLDNGAWLDPDARKPFVDELMRTGRVLGHERQMRTRHGEVIDARVFAERIELNGEECILAATLNVTQEKRQAAQIRALNESLEARVRERTAQLEAANAELEAFSYSVSHDLRAPLRAIDGFTSLLVMDLKDRLSEDEKALVERVLSNTRRMAQLIDDLLDLSRMGRIEFRRSDVDLSGLALEVLGHLAETAPGRKVDWHVEEGMRAQCDARLVRILLENLLGNAWKFTGKRSLAQIRFGTGQAQDGSRCWVISDNGAGFDMTYVAKLFAPFSRLHGMDEFDGTGIGLAIVRRILERHGGHVRAESSPGNGASFRFTLGTS